MHINIVIGLINIIALYAVSLNAQPYTTESLLSIEKIYSGEFQQQSERDIQWIEDGDGYVTIEKSLMAEEPDELIYYNSQSQERSIFVPANSLMVADQFLSVESFSLSPDGSKVLLFNNSSRVWRSNTKGDYWIFNRTTQDIRQIGKDFPSSSLMFAKFSSDNQFIFYVHNFNIYKEEYETGKITQLTKDGDGRIINGTFDWVYEEEFGKRDGFIVNPGDSHLAFWHLDASKTGTYYMINYTDSIYSQPIPLQYPKVGEEPSSAKIGIIDLDSEETHWIPVEGVEYDNYIPGIQWLNNDLLLIQQMNRHQNQLTVWAYTISTKSLRKIYIEKEDTWVDLAYPDVSASGWGNNDLLIVENGTAFLRMTESDDWRHVYKINIDNGEKRDITPYDYDVASLKVVRNDDLYFMASPENVTQRYLYRADLSGDGEASKITPEEYAGLNNYNISPNGKYAIHSHQNTINPRTVRFVNLPKHENLITLVENEVYKNKLAELQMPEVIFTKVTTDEDVTIDVRMVLPPNFDEETSYPVLFHVYGEPWGQVALDNQIGLWNIMMAQKGYVIIDMDNRGTPVLNGSNWRKSIYRKIGIVNTRDQAMAAKEILKLSFLDNNRTAVWGWSGGGSMTLNLMFRYPELYKTGVAIAAVSNQLVYDNIYQERYMGLPSENMEDFIEGSPVTYAKNLKGNLLIIHGTGDDNVHYQSTEILVNELIEQNKQFQMMAYPNRSHGIFEGKNTRKHLYNLITNYILEHTPPN